MKNILEPMFAVRLEAESTFSNVNTVASYLVAQYLAAGPRVQSRTYRSPAELVPARTTQPRLLVMREGA